MNIVKKFSTDLEVERKNSIYSKEAFLEWGLGDDGNLYARYSISGFHSDSWVKSENISFSISLKEMEKIVKEFSKLVIFT